jgi:hypothetical protein
MEEAHPQRSQATTMERLTERSQRNSQVRCVARERQRYSRGSIEADPGSVSLTKPIRITYHPCEKCAATGSVCGPKTDLGHTNHTRTRSRHPCEKCAATGSVCGPKTDLGHTNHTRTRSLHPCEKCAATGSVCGPKTDLGHTNHTRTRSRRRIHLVPPLQIHPLSSHPQSHACTK